MIRGVNKNVIFEQDDYKEKFQLTIRPKKG